jgi:catechol 2,3-dioxygenase-like lactoylglutathione lyase family enzyme
MTGLPGLRSLDHVAFTVPNLDEAIDFFCTHFGASLVYRDGPFRFDGNEMQDRLDVHPRAVTHSTGC